jgi:hypothetical protein
MHIIDMSAFHCRENGSGICPLVMLHLLKTTENQDFEMALTGVESKGLLQTWYQLDGCAQPPSYELQRTASHISKPKVWNKIYIFTQNRGN